MGTTITTLGRTNTVIIGMSPVEIISKNSLSKQLDECLKRPFLTEADSKALVDLMLQRTATLEQNTIEVGDFLTLLENNVTFRASRVAEAIPYNKEALTYVLGHFSEINKAGELSIPEELTKKLSEQELAAVRSVWKDKDQRNIRLLSIYAETVTNLNAFFEKNIARSPEDQHPGLAYFAGAKDIDPVKKNYSVIAPDYTEKDFIHFKKTVNFLMDGLPRSGARDMLYKAFLYFDSHIGYAFDNNYSSVPLAIKRELGDCTESAFLYYALLKMAGQRPVIYLAARNDSQVMHVFVGVKIDGLYYVADGSGVHAAGTFGQAIREQYPKKKYDRLAVLNMELTYKYNDIVKSTKEYTVTDSQDIAPK